MYIVAGRGKPTKPNLFFDNETKSGSKRRNTVKTLKTIIESNRYLVIYISKGRINDAFAYFSFFLSFSL